MEESDQLRVVAVSDFSAHGYNFLMRVMVEVDGRKVGDLTNYAFSYRLKKNIGFALISVDCKPGSAVTVHKDGSAIRGVLQELPFL